MFDTLKKFGPEATVGWMAMMVKMMDTLMYYLIKITWDWLIMPLKLLFKDDHLDMLEKEIHRQKKASEPDLSL